MCCNPRVRWRTLLGAVALSVFLLSPTSCTGGGADDASQSGATTLARSSGAARSTSVPEPSASTTPALDAAECVAAQRAAVGGQAYRIQRATDRVMGNVHRTSLAAGRSVAESASAARAKVAERCGTTPSGMRGYVREAQSASHAPLDVSALARVTTAFAMWAESVGRKATAERLVSARQECWLLQWSVAASYRVWWRWTDEGRAWWVELTVSNGSNHSLWMSLDGAARGKGLLRTESRNPHAQLTWGGSADDGIGVRPNSVTRTPSLSARTRT
jgi:hypothetical protein